MEPQTDMVDAIKQWIESAGLQGVTRAPSRSAFQGELAYYSQCILHEHCERKLRFTLKRQEDSTFL
eukprot:713865-Alexandrium_andersonii.AAC.1